MKLSVERSYLLKAISQAQSVVERRNTIPILSNVLIEAEDDTARFRATDLDIEVVDKAPAQVEQAGSTTVSAITLHEIVRKLPDGALVTLTSDSDKGRLNVEAGRSNFSLATLPKEDFPIMANSEYSSNFSAQASVLRRLFDKSKFAISTEETRYYLIFVSETETAILSSSSSSSLRNSPTVFLGTMTPGMSEAPSGRSASILASLWPSVATHRRTSPPSADAMCM